MITNETSSKELCKFKPSTFYFSRCFHVDLWISIAEISTQITQEPRETTKVLWTISVFMVVLCWKKCTGEYVKGFGACMHAGWIWLAGSLYDLDSTPLFSFYQEWEKFSVHFQVKPTWRKPIPLSYPIEILLYWSLSWT